MAYTSFFRDSDALEAIKTIAIPALSHRREIKVWDAGCATGEEPFTVAILFAASLNPFVFRNVDILASDHEESNFPQFAERIKSAQYSRNDIFWVPEPMRATYFQATDDPELFNVVPEIREKVRYIRHDLLTCVPPESGKSLIVCKNVLMHFSYEDQINVLTMYYEALEPDGFLVLDGSQAMPEECAEQFARAQPGLPLYRKIGA